MARRNRGQDTTEWGQTEAARAGRGRRPRSARIRPILRREGPLTSSRVACSRGPRRQRGPAARSRGAVMARRAGRAGKTGRRLDGALPAPHWPRLWLFPCGPGIGRRRNRLRAWNRTV